MALLKEKVTSIHHWTNKTFSFKTTRDRGFRFKNGEFAMIGLEVDNKPLLRAYSVVSPNHEDHLEFLSIKVPNGPLTSKLQHIKVDDEIQLKSWIIKKDFKKLIFSNIDHVYLVQQLLRVLTFLESYQANSLFGY